MPINDFQRLEDRSSVVAASSLERHRNNFDFLRLFLAALVIFSHSFALGTGVETTEPFLKLSRGQTSGGTIAVDLFFIMSGYLITASFLRSSSILDYLGKRVRRIYPGFIASMILMVLLILPLSGGVLDGGSFGAKILNFLRSTLRLDEPSFVGAFPKNPYPGEVNGSVWTIHFEFECYIGLMVLGACGLLSRRKLMAGIFLGVLVVSVAYSATHVQVTGYSRSRLLPMYLAGVVAYLYRDSIRYTGRMGLACMAGLFGACFIPVAWAAVFPLAGAYLLFWFAFNPFIPAHHAAKFGDLSYGTYLYAFPVQQIIMGVWGTALNPYYLFLLALPITLAVALGSWRFVEQPFLKSQGGLARRRGPPKGQSEKVLGKDIYLAKYRNDLEDEATWLEFGAVLKANSVETLLKRSGIRPVTLLELGSGTGAVIRECRRKSLAETYIAVDASEEATALARQLSPGVRCIVADITDPGFEHGAVDVILLSHVLEHLEHPGDFLRSLVERMSFAWLIAEVPLEDLPAARLKNLFRDRTRNAAGHVQFFTKTSFLNLLTASGLEVAGSLRYVPVCDQKTLEWQLGRMSLSPGGRFIKRLTFRHLPRLFAPLWGTFYHARLAVLCRPAK